MDFYQRALELREETVANRRYLHQNAEVGLDLPKTREFVGGKLQEYGLQPQTCGEGITASLGTNGKVLMLRADIHLLFDNSLLSVDPEDMRIITGTQLKNTEYSELKGRKLRDTVLESERPFSDYLKVHFDKFLQLESA